ncbi:MAG: M20/M25/M40 family metallo-hydrolase, partial [Limisphaera sp.]|nr:M20/M25/M40 family metallo-hydrolase [Limisphaera sp.]
MCIRDRRWSVDLAVVGEPTRLRVVTAHKGSVWVRVEVRGRAAHAATPEQGQNAIAKIARVILAVEEDYAGILAGRRHPLLGSPTVSVGRVEGGTQPNIVADAAWVELDRRTLPGETPRGVLRELQTFLRQRGLRAQVTPMAKAESPPLETPVDHPWVDRFLRAMRQRRVYGVPYFCDAAILSAGGMPAVVYGPGHIAQAHTAEEWVHLAEVERAERSLCRFLEDLP